MHDRQIIQLLFILLAQQVFGELKYVQIWFRHGERLPTHYLHFPGDDATNLDYLQIGYPGELTNQGLRQEFELGTRLRKIYGEHFGNVYKPIEFHVYTGKDNRTSTSAQAMFAGFMPPTQNQKWSDTLNWIPVSQETDRSLDWVSLGAIENCPVYGPTFSKSPKYTKIMGKLETIDPVLVQLISNKTGVNPLTPIKYNHAIDSLKIRFILQDDRLPVPKWALAYKKQILNAAYYIHNEIVQSQNETIGNYHSELVLSLFESYLLTKTSKGTFISGHDTNVVAIWEALRLNHPENIPFFGSHLAIELHEENDVWKLKFFLSMQFNGTREQVFSEFCGIECTLEKLQQLTENSRLLKTDWVSQCVGFEKSPEPVSTITGTMIVLLSVLILSTLILGYTTYSYKRQLNSIRDPERIRLLQ